MLLLLSGNETFSNLGGDSVQRMERRLVPKCRYNHRGNETSGIYSDVGNNRRSKLSIECRTVSVIMRPIADGSPFITKFTRPGNFYNNANPSHT